jgi:hypothetical protein
MPGSADPNLYFTDLDPTPDLGPDHDISSVIFKKTTKISFFCIYHFSNITTVTEQEVWEGKKGKFKEQQKNNNIKNLFIQLQSQKKGTCY